MTKFDENMNVLMRLHLQPLLASLLKNRSPLFFATRWSKSRLDMKQYRYGKKSMVYIRIALKIKKTVDFLLQWEQVQVTTA